MKFGDLYPNNDRRDEFAAIALKEILRAELARPELISHERNVAQLAYRIADEMMEARMGR